MNHPIESIDYYFFKRDNCPLCDAPTCNSQIRFNVLQLHWKVDILQCNKCSLLYKEYAPNDRLLLRIYTSEYGHFKQSVNGENLSSRIERLGLPHGSLLDYGCGMGEFVLQATKAGWDGHGCDPFLPNISHCGNNAHLFHKLDAADVAIKSLGKFDCITMWAVAEHLNYTPAVFSNLASILHKNGRLIFNSPYGDSLISKSNGDLWGMATLVEHIQFHTAQSVHYLAKKCGLKVEKIRYCGTPYPFGKTNLLDQGIPNFLFEKDKLIDVCEGKNIESNKAYPLTSTLKFIHYQLTGNISNRILSNVVREIINFMRSGDHIEVTLIK